MSAPVEWQIPPSVLRWLAQVPRDAPVALLLRHSVREHLAPGDAGYTQPITEVGVKLARDLGAILGARLRSLHTSPLTRCVQTAEGLRLGASSNVSVVIDRLLGDPGAFVLDGKLAWSHWEERGHEGVMAYFVSGQETLPGLAAPDAAARFLVHHLLAAAGPNPGIHVFVTHDALVTAAAARLLGDHLTPADWPWFLEGALFWREGDSVSVAYRDKPQRRRLAALCSLEEGDVVELARREAARTLGLECKARFFLAGGAFKTLLTGRPPRDLDIWAPSRHDREQLVETLLERGARRLDYRPFAEAFAIGDRVVEIPHQVEPGTLEGRLARFDIALSAVGAEHLADGGFRALVDRRALESVERREVLLLKPLVNWRYALVTLERLRRYGAELGFVVPQDEEAEIWRVFAAQSPEMRRGMLHRLARAGSGSGNVHEEASRRLS
ncbi:MAG: histidine phosphatase family protein [Byssovorax sp.]